MTILCDLSLLISQNKVGSGFKNPILVKESIDSLKALISATYGLETSDYYLLSNGKKVDFISEEYNHCCNKDLGLTVKVVLKTLGGKGGFGSMLRAIGAQIEKTTNREACRDLSGRRLRDINEEQRLKNWIAQQAERERETAEKKKKKLERLCQEPKHDFKDDQYDKNRSVMTEEMSSSIDQGFKASSSGISKSSVGLKRKDDEATLKEPPIKKKKTLWIDEMESSSSEDDLDNGDSKQLKHIS